MSVLTRHRNHHREADRQQIDQQLDEALDKLKASTCEIRHYSESLRMEMPNVKRQRAKSG